jgi:hypothetical protein
MSDNNVGKRTIKAFQQDYPEAKPYIQNYARWVKDNEFVANANYDRVSPVMKKLKDETALTPKQIEDGLNRLIKDAGLENTANAKKVEVVIDDMLSNGFESARIGQMPADGDYLKLKSQLEGKKILPQQ